VSLIVFGSLEIIITGEDEVAGEWKAGSFVVDTQQFGSRGMEGDGTSGVLFVQGQYFETSFEEKHLHQMGNHLSKGKMSLYYYY